MLDGKGLFGLGILTQSAQRRRRKGPLRKSFAIFAKNFAPFAFQFFLSLVISQHIFNQRITRPAPTAGVASFRYLCNGSQAPGFDRAFDRTFRNTEAGAD